MSSCVIEYSLSRRGPDFVTRCRLLLSVNTDWYDRSMVTSSPQLLLRCRRCGTGSNGRQISVGVAARFGIHQPRLDFSCWGCWGSLQSGYIVHVHCVQKKKHPLTFCFISPWVMCRFKQKLQWIHLRNGRFSQCRNYIFIAADDVIMTSHL